MYRLFFVSPALLLALGHLAMAQAPSAEGEWRAKYVIAGMQRQAEVIFKGDAGTWLTYNQHARDRNDPCTGRRMPMVVESRDGGVLQILVQRSAEVAGCADFRLELRPVDDRLEGTGRMAGNEVAITLTKK